MARAPSKDVDQLGYTTSVSGRIDPDAGPDTFNGHGFDAVLMDLTIPGGMGGRDAVGALLELDPEARVVVSSGYSQDPVMGDYEKYGFVDVLPKPFVITQLGVTLKRVLGL